MPQLPWEEYQQSSEQGPWTEYQTTSVQPPAKPKTTTDQIWDFGKAFLRTANPVPVDLLKSIYQHGNIATIKGVVQGYGQTQGEQFSKAREAFQKGNYADAARYTAGWLIPFMGPAASQAGEKLAAGQYGEGLRKTLGLGAQIATPAAVGALRNVRTPPVIRPNLNPVEQAAVAFGEREGIPIDAATATGSRVVRNVQGLTQNMLGGGGPAEAMQAAQTQALTQTGERLRQGVEPRLGANVYTPETAGQGIRGALQTRIKRFDKKADLAYGELRRMEQASARPVQVGMQQQPIIQGNTHLGYQPVPVTKQMGFPVDMRPVRTALQPVYDQVRERMPIARQQASPGFRALENIINGEDFIPASTADANLSAIKSISREAESPELRNISQGLAARAVRDLDTAVQQAVAGGGRKATMALQRGRSLTRAKYSAADLLSDLREEPVAAFNQLTARRDSAANLLRDVAKQAPQEMPKLGRAYLEQIFEKATREGGFGRTAALHNDWFALGPEARRQLFRNPALVKDLDSFFLLAKRIATNPNPSGSAHLVSILQTGTLALASPIGAGAQVLSTRAISRILQSPGGAKALTRGMTLPVGNRAIAATVASQILKFAGDDINREDAGP